MDIKEALSYFKQIKILTIVDSDRQCDICGNHALSDCRTSTGQWGYLCKDHLRMGIGLGEGIGQLLITKKEQKEIEELFGDRQYLEAEIKERLLNLLMTR